MKINKEVADAIMSGSIFKIAGLAHVLTEKRMALPGPPPKGGSAEIEHHQWHDFTAVETALDRLAHDSAEPRPSKLLDLEIADSAERVTLRWRFTQETEEWLKRVGSKAALGGQG